MRCVRVPAHVRRCVRYGAELKLREFLDQIGCGGQHDDIVKLGYSQITELWRIDDLGLEKAIPDEAARTRFKEAAAHERSLGTTRRRREGRHASTPVLTCAPARLCPACELKSLTFHVPPVERITEGDVVRLRNGARGRASCAA